MKGLKLGMIVAALTLLMATSVAATQALEIDYVRVDGERIEIGEDPNLRVDLGEEIDIRVRLTNPGNGSSGDIDDIEVMARIVGHDHNDGQTIDIAGPFDLDAGDTDTIDLSVAIPLSADKDEYELRIEVDDRRNDYDEYKVTLRVKDPKTAILVRDIITSPGYNVEAGRALLVQARLENLGTDDLDDVTVIAEIPELGLVGSTFLDEDFDGTTEGNPEIEVSEEILLRIPLCADPGVYDLYVTVEYDYYDETTVKEQIRVIESDACEANMPAKDPVDEGKTVVVPPQAQNVQVGQGGASFPVVITNLGSSAKSYTVTVAGIAGWGVAEVNEPALVIPAGESKIVYAFVSANEGAEPGQKMFNIYVNGESVAAIANVTPAENTQGWGSIKRVLEIVVIVIVVLLIILALIVGFSRLRNDDEDDGQTYY